MNLQSGALMNHSQSADTAEGAETAVLYADRLSGSCGICDALIPHPLSEFHDCPDCGAKFTSIASTIMAPVDEESIVRAFRPDLTYIGHRLP